MAPDARTPSSYKRLLAAVVVAAAFVGSVAATWQRWGDIIIDCGRELDIPKQILAGKSLYRDVRYWYGPLAPYANAALYGLFGVNVSTLAAAGIASAALMAWLTYRTVRLFTGRLAAAATAGALCYTNLFYQCCLNNIFTFAIPYAYPATYGLVAAAGSVYFLLRHVRKRRDWDFLLSAALLGIASLSKVEVLFASGVAHATFLLAWCLDGRLKRGPYVVGYLVALAIPTLVFGWFLVRTGPSLATDNLFTVGFLEAGPFFVTHFGLEDIPRSLADMAWSAAGLGSCVLLGLLAGWMGKRPGGRTAVVVVLASGACAEIVRRLDTGLVFRGLPFALAIALLVWAARWVAVQSTRPAQTASIILCAFALALMSRMGLRVGTEHYGFYLLVPGVMTIAVIYCRDVPALVRSLWGGNGVAPYAVGIVLLTTIGVVHGLRTQEVAALAYGPGATPRVVTPHGSMPCLQTYRGTVDEAIRLLGTQPPSTKVVVIPEGAGITFLAGCTNPLGVHTFLPIDFAGTYDDAMMVERLQETKPDFIVLTARDTSEYGPRQLGVDYGVAVLKWIEAQHYVVAQRLDSPAYRVLILRRNT